MTPRYSSHVDDSWLDAADRAVARDHLHSAGQHFQRGEREFVQAGQEVMTAGRHELVRVERMGRAGLQGGRQTGLSQWEEQGNDPLNEGLHRVQVFKSQQQRDVPSSTYASRSLGKSSMDPNLKRVLEVGAIALADAGLVEIGRALGRREGRKHVASGLDKPLVLSPRQTVVYTRRRV